jgi:hypothetical protein
VARHTIGVKDEQEEPPGFTTTTSNEVVVEDEEPPSSGAGAPHDSTRNKLFGNVSEKHWSDWKWQFRHRITSVKNWQT